MISNTMKDLSLSDGINPPEENARHYRLDHVGFAVSWIYKHRPAANKEGASFGNPRRTPTQFTQGPGGPGRKPMRLVITFAILLLTPTLAFAHTGVDHTMGFMHGFAHPLGGLDHVLAMVAVGVFAATLGGRALWLVPLSFLAMMLVGFGLGVARIDLPMVELAIAASSIVIGAAAAMQRSLPIGAAMALVGSFSVFHGHAHGAEMPVSAEGLQYAAGFLGATALLHLAGLAATVATIKLTGRHARLLTRLAGGAVALGGAGLMAGWL
jgi:urease accessory protein